MVSNMTGLHFKPECYSPISIIYNDPRRNQIDEGRRGGHEHKLNSTDPLSAIDIKNYDEKQ